VLELGCGDGANLLPMAAGLPAAQFVGIDLAARPIAAGQAAVAELALPNLTLTQMDVMAVPPDFGQFDYIIAHGLFSWVPPAVQEQVLRLCQRHLAPTGVAFISYNADPGWHLRRIVRDLLRFHTRAVADPFQRAEAALALLGRLATMAPDDTNVFGNLLAGYSGMLKQMWEEMGSGRLGYILHDILAEENYPVYLADFVARAAGHGLRYLTDAKVQSSHLGPVPGSVAAMLDTLAVDPLEREQYLDFLMGETFHRSLLIHQALAPAPAPQPEQVRHLAVLSPVQEVVPAGGRRRAVVPVTFHAPDGTSLTVEELLSQAALRLLAERWPQAVPFEELARAAWAQLKPPKSTNPAGLPPGSDVLASDLLRGFCLSNSLVSFHAHIPQVAAAAGERPLASPVARFEARRGAATVTNLYHERIDLDAFRHCLLGLLDGTRDRAALQSALVELAATGTLSFLRQGQPIRDPASLHPIIEQRLEPNLAWLAWSALLVDA
jgi:SAM-dependent methyltransferase